MAALAFKSFSSSGSWVIPPGVFVIEVEMCGGGGGGGGGTVGGTTATNPTCGGGGGGGAQMVRARLTALIVPNHTITVTVGAGGAGGAAGAAGSRGTNSSIADGGQTLAVAFGASGGLQGLLGAATGVHASGGYPTASTGTTSGNDSDTGVRMSDIFSGPLVPGHGGHTVSQSGSVQATAGIGCSPAISTYGTAVGGAQGTFGTTSTNPGGGGGGGGGSGSYGNGAAGANGGNGSAGAGGAAAAAGSNAAANSGAGGGGGGSGGSGTSGGAGSAGGNGGSGQITIYWFE